jgi:ligand-binding SRPBCC domain-containing protein
MSVICSLPLSFTISFKQKDFFTYKILTSQVLPLSPDGVFHFFEDPRNLSTITPQWLDFRMINSNNAEVFKGAQFVYTIRWLGVKIRWRTKITDYEKPVRFTDIQLSGPYRSWQHIHTFEKIPEGTRMHDDVTYRIPLIAKPLYSIIIKKQLEDIFSYRAVRIADRFNTY